MSLKALLISVLLLSTGSIIHGHPLVSPRDNAQQPEVFPFTGVNPSDQHMIHSPNGYHTSAAAIAMVISAEQSKGTPETILIPYGHLNMPSSPTNLFVPPASTLTFHTIVSHSPTPSLRTPEDTPEIYPALQSDRSQHNVLILAIIISTILGLLVVSTIGKYTFEYLWQAQRKFRISQESWGHKDKVVVPLDPEVAAPNKDALTEEQSLRNFSFPSRPGCKVARIQNPNDVPSELSTGNRFSTFIAPAAFRQSYLGRDSITTQDTTSTMSYLFMIPPNSQGDHLRTRSVPVTIGSMSTVKPARWSGTSRGSTTHPELTNTF